MLAPVRSLSPGVGGPDGAVSAALWPRGNLDITPRPPYCRTGGCPGNVHVILSEKEKGMHTWRKLCLCVRV